MTGIAITGWGTALPEKVVTNDHLAQYLDTSDEWITERTGIRERRIGGTTGGLAVEAGRNALKQAGVEGSEVDLIILATSTPDQVMPPTSATVQAELGIAGGSLDMNVACSGFVYALAAAHGMILGGMKKILVIGSDVMSKIVDQQDRATAVLFGDGAGAVLLEATDGPDQLLATNVRSDGSLAGILKVETGGTLEMKGADVYKHAVLMCVASIKQACSEAGIEPADVDLFVPHQANLRIVHAVTSRLGMDSAKSAIVLDRTGNTSAASIPLALFEAIEKKQVKDGDTVVFCGFGAGMSIATQIWKWGK